MSGQADGPRPIRWRSSGTTPRRRSGWRCRVQAAVDLLPDTPHIRDLRTFADWRNTIILLSVLLVYLLLGSLYFKRFFENNACEHAVCKLR